MTIAEREKFDSSEGFDAICVMFSVFSVTRDRCMWQADTIEEMLGEYRARHAKSDPETPEEEQYIDYRSGQANKTSDRKYQAQKLT